MNVSTRTSTTATRNTCQSKVNLLAKPAHFMRWLFLLLTLATFSVNAQTTLISATGATSAHGGFEAAVPTGTSTTDFTANGWSVANGASNLFYVGSAPVASAGTYCAFTGTSASSWVGQAAATVSHIYTDVTIPAGEPNLTLSFKYKVSAVDATFDFLKAYIVSTTTVPIAGSQLSSGQMGLIAGYDGTTSYVTYTLNGTATPGTTVRLVISYRSDGVTPHGAGALDELSLVSNATAPAATSSTTNGGLWSSPATWVGGVVPAVGTDVTIPSGSIVTVDQVTNVRNLQIDGTLLWGSSTFVQTVIGDVTVNSGGTFLPYTTGGTGQTINIGGNFTNNGFVNATLTSLNFNGSQVSGGSSSQSLSGTGTFLGTGSDGIVRSVNCQTTGSLSISTSQNIITSSYVHTAGTVNTGGKLKIDNTAQVYGQAINQQVASASITAMGSLYSVAPVVFGTAVTQYVSGLAATTGTRYISGTNVYLCTTAGTFNATAPTSTTPAATFTTSGPALLYLGQVGQLGNPFQITAVTAGTQYFYNGNLYTCTVAGTPTAATAPVHTSGTATSGTATFLYVGTPATATLNYDATTQTVRSINITSAGTGYSTSAPTIAISVGVTGGTGSGATAVATLFQQIAGPANSLTQKTTGTTISGGITINSDQGASIATLNGQASSGVGAVSTSNGGINYTVAPNVGFALPPTLNLITNPGSGYIATPTVTVTGGTLISGSALTTSNFTITVNNGKVESVYLNTGTTATYSTLPTLALTASPGVTATLAFPAGCLPTATAVLGTNGQIKDFTITNAGFGYAAAPTVGISGGTFTTAATTPTARIGLYSLTLNFFAPATSATPNADDASIPTNRKLNTLTLAGNGNGLVLTNNLTLFGTAPLSLTASLNTPGNILDLGGNNLYFSWNGYAGASSTFGASNTYIKNGSMTLTGRGGASTFTYPFSGTFTWFAGSTPTTVTTGSTVTSATVTETAAPTGSGAIGTRAFRVVTNAGSNYGLNPTVAMNYNTVDALPSGGNQVDLYISQSAALSGAWTPRSASSGSGTVGTSGTRTTATTGLGPVVPTGDDFYAWTSVTLDTSAVSVQPATCAATAHLVSADLTTSAGTITGVTITYNNGAAVGPVAMTNTSGNTWQFTIPAASPSNTTVTWSITATNSAGISKTFVGSSYQDDATNGVTGTVSASVNPVCSGSPTVLTANFSKPGTATIGTATTLTSATAQPTAFCNRWPSYRMQTLFTAAELQAAGLRAGNITAMTYNITTLGDAATNAGYSVRIGNTASTAMTAFEDSTVMTSVWNQGTFTHAVGLNTITFASPFNWNGTSNIIVQVVHNGANATNNSITYFTATTGTNTVAYTSTASSNSASLSVNRLNTTFSGNTSPAFAVINWNDGTSDFATGNTTTVSPTTTTSYTATGVTAAGCSITTSPALTVNVNALPASPSGGNSTQCGNGIPTAFVASGGQNGQFRWYSAATGGTLLQGPSTATTYGSSISTTTTFYVSESANFDGSGCESARIPVTATVNAPDAISATPSDVNPCTNTAITLTAANIAAIPTNIYTYTWTGSPQAGSGLPIGGTPGTSISVTPTVPGTYTYTASAVDGSCATSATTVSVVVKALPLISAATATPSTVCAGTNVTLNGSTLSPTPTTVQIGSGTGSSSASSTIGAFYGTWYGNGHAQILIKASELTAAGFVAGNLTDLKIDLSQLASAPDNIVNGFTIKLASISAATTAITTFQSATFTTVYGPTNYTPVVGTNTHSFIAPYNWDGVSNIIVDYCFTNGITGNSAAINTVTSTAFGSFVNNQVDGSVPTECTVTTVSNASTSRPNIKLTGQVLTPGAGTFTWSWTDITNAGSPVAGNSIVVAPTSTTTYQVSATDPATTCTNTQNVVVTVNPVPAQPTANTGDDLCGPGIPTISLVSNSGFPTPTFNWYSAATGGTLLQSSTSTSYTSSISTTTTFYVTEATATCESSPRVAVTQVVNTPDALSATANTTAVSLNLCLGSTIDLDAIQSGGNGNTYAFSWTATGGANSGVTGTLTGQQQTGITPLAVGTYTYTVVGFDDQSNCTATSSVTVTVYPVPSGATANASSLSVCTGSTIDLTSSGVSGIGVPFTDYTQDFETAFPQAGMTYINAGTSPNSWTSSTVSHTGTGAIAYNWNGTNAANTWAITPAQALTAGATYTVTFWYKVISASFPEKLKVTVGTNNTVAAQTTVLWDNNGGTDLTNTTYAQGTTTFVAPTTGNYYFAWNCYSDPDEDVLYVDDISIAGPGAEIPTFTWTSAPSGFTSSLQNPTNVVVTANTTYTVSVGNSGGCSATASVAVTAIPLPNAPVANNSTQCGPGVPTASVSTGGSNGTYNWFDAATGGTLLQAGGSTYTTSISGTGVHNFYVSENDGTCESLRTLVTVTITDPPTLAITPGGATTFCQGGSVSLDATTGSDPSYTGFTWTPATGLSATNVAVVTANPSTTQTYTVTATGGGCTNTATITVTVNPNPVITTATATPATICVGGSSTLAATIVDAAAGSASVGTTTTTIGGNDGNPYRSGNGTGFQIHTQLLYTAAELNAAGITTGNITSIGFTTTAASTGTLNGFTIKMGTTAATTMNTTFQPAPLTTVFTQASFTPASSGLNVHTFPVPFAWDGTSNILVDICQTNNILGTATVNAYTPSYASQTYLAGSTTSCSAVTGVAMSTKPVATFGAQVGTDLTSSYDWVWNPGALPGATVAVSPTTPGANNYSVTATNPVTLCTSTFSPVVVTVATVGGAPTATATTICAGQSTTISANATGGGPFTYLWDDPAASTTASITVSPATTTTYSVIITDFCSNSTAPLPTTITVNPLPTVSIVEVGPFTICQPATQVLTASTAAVTPSYQWTLNGTDIPSATSSTYTVTATGSYAVKVTDANTCTSLPSAAVSVTVNQQPSAVTVAPATATICAGDPVTLVASGGTIGGTYTLGTDVTTTVTSGITPYNSNWEGSRVQYLVRASELTGLGMGAGELNSLAFDVTALGGGTFAQSGFTIKIAHTADATLNGTNYGTPTGSFTSVYGPVSQGLPTLGLNTYTFSTPFNWDGVSNILIDICHDNDITATCASCFSSSSTVKYTNTSFNSTFGRYGDNAQACGVNASLAATTFTNRPNMVFNSSQPVTITWDNAGTLNTSTGATVIATPLATTTYTATATSPLGCANAGSSVITVNQCPSTLNLVTFLEGFYRGTATMASTTYDIGNSVDPTETDTLIVNLTDPAHTDINTYPTPDYTAQAVLHTDGTSTVTFPAGLGGLPFYISVKHRNSMETWSKNPVIMKPVTGYNFSTGLGQAYDDGVLPPMQNMGGGIYAFYAGDINQDGAIDASDMNVIDNENGFFGYNVSDASGDGATDATDMNFVDNNSQLGLFMARPL